MLESVTGHNMVSVTNSATLDNLRGTNTKGFDFVQNVRVAGYEVVDDRTHYAPMREKVMSGPKGIGSWRRYNQNVLFYGSELRTRASGPDPAGSRDDIDTTSPWLVPKRGDRSPYFRDCEPLSNPALHRRFAALKTEHLETEVVNFANRYGMLGWTTRVDSRTPAIPRHGESLLRWHSEIDKMGLLLAVWDMVTGKEAGALRRLVHWHGSGTVMMVFKWKRVKGRYEFSAWDSWDEEETRVERAQGYGHVAEAIASDNWTAWFHEQHNIGAVIGPARHWVCHVLNYHLHGVIPQLIAWPKRTVGFVPTNLLDALWLLFMLEVQGKVRVGRCEYCGEWFELKRNTKTYCGGNCRRLAFYHKRR